VHGRHQVLRYEGASICAFDKGLSMLTLVKACGGKHYDIGADGKSPAFCPLSVLEDASDLERVDILVWRHIVGGAASFVDSGATTHLYEIALDRAVIARWFDVVRFSNFIGVVTRRQAASLCRDGVDRRWTLELFDAEIEVFDDLIATPRLSAATKDRSRFICIRVTSSIRVGGSIAARVGGGAS
jgi:hypothetical protein